MIASVQRRPGRRIACCERQVGLGGRQYICYYSLTETVEAVVSGSRPAVLMVVYIASIGRQWAEQVIGQLQSVCEARVAP